MQIKTMGNSGSNKIHSKSEIDRVDDYRHSSLQRVNPKVYNGGFKVLPERLPNQRLRSTDNGSVLHNGGTLSGRRPTSIGGFPEPNSVLQPPPLPPPLSEEELKQLLKKRNQYNPRHSNEALFSRNNYMPESTQSNIDFRLSKSHPSSGENSKKKLFNRKSKAPLPPPEPDEVEERIKKSNKKEFANFFSQKRSSPTTGEIDDGASYLLPPPSQFVTSEINAASSKVESKDKKSITYVLERRDTSVSPTSEGQRSSLSGAAAAAEREGRYIKRANSPPEHHNRYGGVSGRIGNSHLMVHGQLSDGGVHSSTLDRADSRHRINESLQKRVRSMDSLVHNEEINPQLHPSTRNELKEKLAKMSKNFNQSMDNLYVLSKSNNVNDSSLVRKAKMMPDGDKIHGEVQQQQKEMKSESNIRTNPYVGRGEPFKLHDKKAGGDEMMKVQHDADAFQLSTDFKSKDNHRSSAVPHVRPASSESPEMVSEHVQEAFFAKTRETRSGVLEFNKRIGSGNLKKSLEAGKTSTPELQELSSDDDMDIDMQLRPTLPKRHHAVPRFSPTHVWRSLVVEADGDRFSIHSSDDEEEGDVYEDRIQRVARPMAPPKTINEKSADSGISPGAVSPLPVSYDFEITEKTPNKTNTTSSSPSSKNNASSSKNHRSSLTKTNNVPTKDRFSLNLQREHSNPDKKGAAWTPEEDLASDFDAGSGDIPVVIPEIPHPTSWGLNHKPEMVSSHPKLTSRKDMFSNNKYHMMLNGEDNPKKLLKGPATTVQNNDEVSTAPAGQTFNSVRKLKRSLSGVLQNNMRNRLSAGEVNGANGGGGGVGATEMKPTSLDDNWSLSRSLPNSLHNGHEGEKLSEYKGPKKAAVETRNRVTERNRTAPSLQTPKYFDAGGYFEPRLNRSESGPIFFGGAELSSLNPVGNGNFIQSRPFTDLEGRTFNNSRSAVNNGGKNRVMYLPKYEAMQIIDEKQMMTKPERKAYSDLGTRTETNIPDVRSSATLNSREQNNHHKKKKGKKFTYQSTVRQLERKQLEQKLSREVALEEKRRADEMALVNKVEEEFQKKRDREKVSIRQQLRILNLKDENGHDIDEDNFPENNNQLDDETDDDKEVFLESELHSLPWDHSRHHVLHNYDDGPTSLPLHIPPADYELPKSKYNYNGVTGPAFPDSATHSSKLFSGIGRWIKKQPSPTTKDEHHDYKNGNKSSEQLSRLEPEGAPSSLTLQDGAGNRQSSPHQESRGRAITGSKFSSGRSPDITFGVPKKSGAISNHEKAQEKNPDKDTRTSVWLSPENTYPSANSSKLAARNNFYSQPFDSVDHLNGQPDYRYYPSNSGPTSMPFEISSANKRMEDDNRYFHGGVGPSQDILQRNEWRTTGGQRHSIAIDTSSSSSRGGGGGRDTGSWMNEGYRYPDGSSNNSAKDTSKSPTNSQKQTNGHNYNEFSSTNGTDYKMRQNSPGLNSNQRSLSFSHIPGLNNNTGQNRSSRIPVPTLVQPFNPNKAYRPVPFYSSNPYGYRK